MWYLKRYKDTRARVCVTRHWRMCPTKDYITLDHRQTETNAKVTTIRAAAGAWCAFRDNAVVLGTGGKSIIIYSINFVFKKFHV